MSNYSKGHERDENRRMNKGLVHALFAVLFCWLPLVGQLLAASGFLRVVVRVTQEHRLKKGLLTVLTLIVLAGCIGVLGAEVYYYTRDPGILDTGVLQVWHALTGQETLPWKAADPFSQQDPEDSFSGYGNDPYAVNLDDYSDSEPDADYDADFDDSELDGFEEDAAPDLSQKDLFDQMRESENSAIPKG